MIRLVRAETLKLASLPSIWVASALTLVIPVLLAMLDAQVLRHALQTGQTGDLESTSTVDGGFGQLIFGLVGVVVLGVVSISSEYARNARTVGAGRQISTTMTAAPARGHLMAAKLVVLVVWVTVLAAVTIPATVRVSHVGLGDYATPLGRELWTRSLGVLAYWVAMALIGFCLAAVLRNGVIPLVLLITNVSVVSFSLLLAGVTPLARFLPDMAAYPLFLTEHPMAHPLVGGAAATVLALWAVAAVAATLASYAARDA